MKLNVEQLIKSWRYGETESVIEQLAKSINAINEAGDEKPKIGKDGDACPRCVLLGTTVCENSDCEGDKPISERLAAAAVGAMEACLRFGSSSAIFRELTDTYRAAKEAPCSK